MLKLPHTDEPLQVELCQVDGGVPCLWVIDHPLTSYGGGEFFGEVRGLDHALSVRQSSPTVSVHWDAVNIDDGAGAQQQQLSGVNVRHPLSPEVFISLHSKYRLNKKGDDVREMKLIHSPSRCNFLHAFFFLFQTKVDLSSQFTLILSQNYR